MRFTTGRVLVIAVLAIAAGVGSASAFVPKFGSDSPASPDSLQPDGGATVLRSEMPDPAGGPDWAVRTYVSKTGQTCPEVGRVDGGRFGRVDADGAFTELPVDAAGSCADLAQSIAASAVNRYPETADRGARIAIFGVVSPTVREVELRTPTHVQPLTLDHASFLAVRAEPAPERLVLTFTTKDGQKVSHAIRHPDTA